MKIIHGFPQHLRHAAASIYLEAFEQKIGWLLGTRQKAITYLANVMDPHFAFCAIEENEGQEKLVGFAGFKTAKGGLVGDGFSGLVENYGLLSSLWRTPILSLLERKVEPDILLMDGIAVTPDQRGKGTGTKLLNAINSHARATGRHYVRLDVIDTNPRARALYESRGFKPTEKENLGPLKYLFGFSSSTTMVLKV